MMKRQCDRWLLKERPSRMKRQRRRETQQPQRLGMMGTRRPELRSLGRRRQIDRLWECRAYIRCFVHFTDALMHARCMFKLMLQQHHAYLRAGQGQLK